MVVRANSPQLEIMKDQLVLAEDQLKAIGFIERKIEGDELNAPCSVFEIPFLNGCFYFNMRDTENRWYCQMLIGNHANDICLDIQNIPTLFVLLHSFKVKFDLVIY